MSLFQTASKRVGAIFLVTALLGGGLVFADGAGAAQVQPEMDCVYMGGYEICGSMQYLLSANIAGQNAINAAAANQAPIKNNYCAEVDAVTVSFNVLFVFLPETAIITYIMDSVTGLTIGELQECNF